MLWVVLIFLGTFLRGPNWNFFGPYEYWDPHKAEALNNIDISDIFWTEHHAPRPADLRQQPDRRIAVLARPRMARLRAGRRLILLSCRSCCASLSSAGMYENMGAIRYTVMVFLLLFMALMPIKMVLRWLFNLKYFIYLPEFNANL